MADEVNLPGRVVSAALESLACSDGRALGSVERTTKSVKRRLIDHNEREANV